MNYCEAVIVWETGLNIEQRCSDFEVILASLGSCRESQAWSKCLFIYANVCKQVIQNVGSIWSLIPTLNPLTCGITISFTLTGTVTDLIVKYCNTISGNLFNFSILCPLPRSFFSSPASVFSGKSTVILSVFPILTQLLFVLLICLLAFKNILSLLHCALSFFSAEWLHQDSVLHHSLSKKQYSHVSQGSAADHFWFFCFES